MVANSMRADRIIEVHISLFYWLQSTTMTLHIVVVLYSPCLFLLFLSVCPPSIYCTPSWFSVFSTQATVSWINDAAREHFVWLLMISFCFLLFWSLCVQWCRDLVLRLSSALLRQAVSVQCLWTQPMCPRRHLCSQESIGGSVSVPTWVARPPVWQG